MEIRVKIDNKEYDVNVNLLYKERVDNELSTSQLVEKYESRIVNGTL